MVYELLNIDELLKLLKDLTTGYTNIHSLLVVCSKSYHFVDHLIMECIISHDVYSTPKYPCHMNMQLQYFLVTRQRGAA